jgi:hypothetical protein
MKIRLLLLSSVVALIVFASCKKTQTNTVIQHDTTTVKTFDTTSYAMVDSVFSDLNGTPFPAYAYPYIYNYKSTGYNGNPFYYLEIDPSDSNNNYYDIYIGTSLPAYTARTYGAYGDTTTETDLDIYFNGKYYYGSTVLNPNTITVTSISGSSMKGTFQGTVYVNGDTTQTGSNKQVITNGKFSIRAL